MSESEIQVILSELRNIKEDISEIKQDIKERCNTCVNTSTLKERLRSQWTHILGIWTVIGAYMSYKIMGR
jgi:peptidoglycan hydrolase CwlO-like protein